MKLTFSCHNVRYMQLVTAVIATLLIANTGMYVSWPSPSLPKLQSNDSPTGETISKGEASWVASSFLFGILLGGSITGIIMEKLGRKWSLLFCAVPLFAGWIVLIFARKVIIIIIARTVAGIGGAMALAAVPVYCGEIAENDIRGKLGTVFNILKLFGSLYVLSIGPYTSYTVLTLCCSVLPVIFVVLFFFMPESPMYLVKIGKKDLATKNLIRLSSNGTDDKGIERRMEEIQTTVDYDMRNRSTMKEFLTNPEYRMSLIVMTGIKSLQQLSGMNAIDPYLLTIIRASNSGIPEDISSIVCGVVQIFGALCSAVLVDKMGRKPLLIISALGCATALITLGTYFYLDQVVKTDLSNVSWLPTTALALYLFMNPLGIFTLSYVLLGELFATNIKGSAITVMTVYGALLGFLVAKFFEPISTAWGMYTMFWIFAGFCIAGTIFVFFFLPETKGKSFMDIQKKLNRHRNLDPYLQTIIRESNGSIPEDVSTIVCGVVQLLGALGAAVLIERMGRKPLLIISALGCAVALIAEGTYFYLQKVANQDVSGISWLPTTALALYLVMNPLGVFTVPFVLMGELFATNIKGSAATVMTVYGAFVSFMVAKFFEPISTAWGMHTMFWIFAGCCVTGSIFVFFFLPETKGKSFMEIQKKLNKNKVYS